MNYSRRQEIDVEALDALRQDKGPDANPYPEGSEEYHAWLESWTDASDALREGE